MSEPENDNCPHCGAVGKFKDGEFYKCGTPVKIPWSRDEMQLQSHFSFRCASNQRLSAIKTMQALTTCRDHWKTSFDHERENVIRLRGIVYDFHADDCICPDCQLVRQHRAGSETVPPK